MKRRKFLMSLPLAGIIPAQMTGITPFSGSRYPGADPAGDATSRMYWLSVAERLAKPVLTNLSAGMLRENMPVEAREGHEASRRQVSHLEAFGRLMAGLAPWLGLEGISERNEQDLQATMLKDYYKAMRNAVDPASPDFMNFTEGRQPLVDAAFLAQALLRAPGVLFDPLDKDTKEYLRKALVSTRVINPGYNNWLLFTALVEAALMEFYDEGDMVRISYAVNKHNEWYVGDGTYGDGAEYHWDYYNSYVIQPMLTDLAGVLVKHGKAEKKWYEKVLTRARRYAEIQERLISPEGTFPAFGRSIAYRYGALQSLAQASLLNNLPEDVSPGQVKSAMSAVIRKMTEMPGTFDENGWLKIGFCGAQPGIETYISTGSLYLCSEALLPLGLSPDHDFWTSPFTGWTSRKAWSGQAFPIDHALHS